MIGPVTLAGRAVLAPMCSGVTDIGMRRIARRYGASMVVSEMVASDDDVKGEAEAQLRAEGEGSIRMSCRSPAANLLDGRGGRLAERMARLLSILIWAARPSASLAAMPDRL